MALLYLIAGFGCGKIHRFSFKKIAQGFGRGVLGIAPSVILILMGVSVKHIIVEGHIRDTLLEMAATNLQGCSPYVGILMIYVLVLIGNFFIAFASVKAFLLIPLLLPLCPTIGLTRQSMITAWAFGDGFSNMIYPTNAVLLIALGITGISYSKWFRWTIALQIMIFITTLIYLILAVAMHYGP